MRREEAFGETPNATRGTRVLPLMFVRQTWGHFSRTKALSIGLHYPKILANSQQKPEKRNFSEKKFWVSLKVSGFRFQVEGSIRRLNSWSGMGLKFSVFSFQWQRWMDRMDGMDLHFIWAA